MYIFLYHNTGLTIYIRNVYVKRTDYLGPVTSMQNILKKGNKGVSSMGQKDRTKPYQPKDSIEQE